jgi:hypothetical protein
MFQSIEYKGCRGYNVATKLYQYEYELTDSDFGKVVAVVVAGGVAGATVLAVAGVVIQEYSKRKLNVAANLFRCFRHQEKKYGYSIAQQIAWAEEWQPLFTPQIKAELDKYLILI